jgi:hypothetical protein
MGAVSVHAVARQTQRERALIAVAGGGSDVRAADKVVALLDAVRALRAADIPHALIGGVAVSVHSAVPRATDDIDFAIPSDRNRDEVVAMMLAAGFTLRGRFDHSLNFRHGSGEPVQFALDPRFDPMIARAGCFELDGERVVIVSLDDLIALKSMAAADPRRRPSKRLRDEADIALLRGDRPDPDEGW